MFWNSYQWRYTGTTIKNEKLNFWKKFDYEKSFLHRFILNTVSMGIQREDDQKWKTLNFYRNYFIMKDNLRKVLFWKSHQWRYIATTIKIENLNSIKLFDQEGSFRHSFFLIIVSMGVHRNNDKKNFEVYENFFVMKDHF